MGNGTKFKLSNVLPNVFSKIKGIGSAPKKINGRPRGSGSSSTLSEWGMNDRLDQNDFCVVSRHSQAERSPSPVRIFPQNRSRDSRHSLSPSLGQKAYDIRFPAESPVRSTRGNKSRSDSPPPHGPTRFQNSVQPDPGCCSFDSSATFVPIQPEGRVVVRKEFPSFGRSFSIMSKCNSFNGSTHSDSDISESDTSRARSSRRFRHSRTVSVHLDGNAGSAPSCCDGSGYGVLTKAASSHAVSGTPLETASARGRSASTGRLGLRARRKSSDTHNVPTTPTATTRHVEHCQQLYGGSSPIHSDRRLYEDGSTPTSSYYKADYSKADRGMEVRHGKSGGGSTGAASCPDSRRELERTGSDFRQEATTPGAGSGRMGRFSRKLSFAIAGGDNKINTTNDPVAVAGRPSNFDDTSFSSDEGTFGGRNDGNAKVSINKGRLRSGSTPVVAAQSKPHSQRSTYSRVEDAEKLGYAPREVALAQEEDHGSRDDNALFQQERNSMLAEAVVEASDGWARVHLSRLSNDEKPTSTTRVSQEGRDVKAMGARGRSIGAGNGKGEFQTGAAVGAVQNWSGGSFRATGAIGERANFNEAGNDRESLARLRGAGALDHILVRKDEEGEKIKVQLSHGSFRSPPNSKDASSRRSSISASPIGEVEKHTEGKINYKSCSPLGSSNRAIQQQQKASVAGFIFADEEFTRPGTDLGGKIFNYSDRSENSAKEFGSTWDTEFNFPSFRSDSMLVGVGKLGTGQIMLEERATMIDFPEFSESKVPTPRTPGQFERKKQNKIGGHCGRVHDHGQNDRGGHGRTSNRSPSPGPRDEVTRAGLKPSRVANTQSKSPARRPLQDLGGTRPRMSGAQPTPEFYGNGKKLSTRSPSPAKDFGSKRFSNRSPAPTHDHHGHTAPDFSTRPVRKTGRTPSPARDRSPTPKPAPAAKKLSAKAEAGMQRLDSVAVVKASYDPYQDFRTSMVEMILENDIRTSGDLEDLLQCYLSLNSSDYHKVIVQVFTDIWGDIFEK